MCFYETMISKYEDNIYKYLQSHNCFTLYKYIGNHKLLTLLIDKNIKSCWKDHRNISS